MAGKLARFERVTYPEGSTAQNFPAIGPPLSTICPVVQLCNKALPAGRVKIAVKNHCESCFWLLTC